MKAYALVGRRTTRRSAGALLEFPWPRLYEHPWMNCALAIERSYQGEQGVFVGLFRAPEQQTIGQLQEALAWYKHQPLEKVGCLPPGPAGQPRARGRSAGSSGGAR